MDLWLDKLTIEISRWISLSYEEIIGKQAVKLGEEELTHITQLVEQKREALR